MTLRKTFEKSVSAQNHFPLTADDFKNECEPILAFVAEWEKVYGSKLVYQTSRISFHDSPMMSKTLHPQGVSYIVFKSERTKDEKQEGEFCISLDASELMVTVRAYDLCRHIQPMKSYEALEALAKWLPQHAEATRHKTISLIFDKIEPFFKEGKLLVEPMMLPRVA